MRIDAVKISNFRGIESAELHDLGDSPLVTVSGPNGAGKSLLFEAIALIWRIVSVAERNQLVPTSVIGPWAKTSEIEVAVVLAEEEKQALKTYLEAAQVSEKPQARAVLAMQVKRDEAVQLDFEPWARPLLGVDFTSTHQWANVDFFPADRTFPRGEQASVNPALLSDQQREGFRDQIVGSFVQQRQIVNLSGIAPVLASLDYVDLLAERDKRAGSGDFDALTDAFAASTSKIIQRPRLDPGSAYGAVLLVETPAGVTHTIDQLSSGEQEVLGLMYFIRRLSSRGGVLLVDEPELHLHPSLQRGLFSALEATAERAQVWIATHSPRMVAAAPLNAIVHMRPATGKNDNQVTRASDEATRMQLLEDLGVHPIEALQSDALMVVEGATDVQRLSELLPLEFGRTVTLVAGNGAAVETVARMLNEGNIPIPHLAIRDRDDLTDDHVAALMNDIPHLFVWNYRSIENHILHPPLLAKTLERAGKSISAEEVEAKLLELSDRQRENVHAEIVEARLTREHAYTKGGTTPIERRKHHLQEVERVAGEKLEAWDHVSEEVARELDERWPSEFIVFVDGKRLLAEFVEFTGFRSPRDFIAALMQTVREHQDLLPPAVAALREAMRETMKDD
jgi:predicted ATPase